MSNIRIAELDFDSIKTNLKTFLQSQSEFTDYDFEGSGLSVLLDVLAYNTHYNAYLANMLANEMFIDSAVKRASVVSLAKHLGYTPKSVNAARAILDVTVNNPNGSPSTLTLERYSSFSSTIDSVPYSFLTTQPYTIQPVNNVYTFNDVVVREGRVLEYKHNVVTPGPDEKYEIPNSDVDTSTLLVTVQKSNSDTTSTTYTLATDITDVNGTSAVYFLEENPFGKYQIYFGDGIIGRILETGNIVRIQYIVSSGSAANVSSNIPQTFSFNGTVGGSSNIVVVTVGNSTGGAERETITSIKFNAQKNNLAKSRAVTKTDYASIIKAQYSSIESISVWGGEENTPPIYGKVFISLKPYQGNIISDEEKLEIKNSLLKDRQMLTTTPEIVDPDYIYVNLNTSVNYNKNQTTLSSSQIQLLVKDKIINYFNTQLQQFEKPFYYSQLTESISKSDSSILSVLLGLKLQKRIQPILNVTNSYIDTNSIKFNNRLHPGGLESTKFFVVLNGITYTVRLKDLSDVLPPDYNGTGTVRMYNVEDGIDLGSVGTINYVTGEVTLIKLQPVGYPANQYEIALTCGVQEESFNITAFKNQIIVLDDSVESSVSNRLPGLTINVIAI